ncbi:uncharacterized protein PSFLO_00488 [Pseudozyma flocculosa]|uniref:Uncharacterized protein n=1 Tax=Pseudozyma flocculosa TaxID=84751 RepID=A0A5C3EU62_9BASI|nr:uncharacterized protein PSFLO_00488 [Pseudozyma flocculosa]
MNSSGGHRWLAGSHAVEGKPPERAFRRHTASCRFSTGLRETGDVPGGMNRWREGGGGRETKGKQGRAGGGDDDDGSMPVEMNHRIAELRFDEARAGTRVWMHHGPWALNDPGLAPSNEADGQTRQARKVGGPDECGWDLSARHDGLLPSLSPPSLVIAVF